ncbi:MAG: hypothetical protein DDT22_00856 [candidate division WS2 bacterium]|nr:hypothetical protein [Candidatus Lithacetigena glycinireducens]
MDYHFDILRKIAMRHVLAARVDVPDVALGIGEAEQLGFIPIMVQREILMSQNTRKRITQTSPLISDNWKYEEKGVVVEPSAFPQTYWVGNSLVVM